MTTRAQTVTILFTDLVGSTELLQRAGDEQAQRIFKAHHRLLREAVEAHGGNEVKWLGDGLMVAFDSAADAVKCAIAMQQMSRRPTAGERLEIRAGLHVGEAFVDESDFFGTSVVIARRLCDKANAGQILASDIVVRLLDERGDGISTNDLGPLELKGIANAVPAVEIIYEHDPMALLRKLPFVGRAAEYETMLQKLADARNSRGAVVLLAGEPGIGKTRLAEEFCESASGSATVIRGNSYEADVAAPFGPWVEALRSLIEQTPDAHLRDALGPGAPDIAVLMPEIKRRLPDLEDAPRFDPESERARLFQSIGAFLANAAAQKPLVIVLDDLHWCDGPSLALLEQIARRCAQQGIMIVGAYRDVEVYRVHPLARTLAGLRRMEHYQRIAIRGFTQDSLYDLLNAIEPAEEAESAMRALAQVLHAEADGNPFFIREVLNNMIETGTLAHEDGVWIGTATSIEELGIPDGIKEMIGHRLSLLSETCNRMLGRASAMTSGFTWDELRAICDDSEAELLDALDEALGSQLIAERSRNTYAFTHALIRATLYGELSTPRRVQLHRRVAEGLESLYATEIDDHLGELAAHYMASMGRDEAKAIEYSIRAGDRAQQLFAWEAAAAHYERALDAFELSASPEQRTCIDILLALGRALNMAGADRERWRAVFARAAELGQQAGDPERCARAALGFADLYPTPGALDAELVHLLEVALKLHGPAASSVHARMLARLGNELSFSEQPERKKQFLENAVDMARGIDDPETLAYVLSSYLWEDMRAVDGLRLAHEQVEAAIRSGDKFVELRARNNLATYALVLGDRARFDREIDEETRLERELRIVDYWTGLHRALSVRMEGRFDEAERMALQSYAGLQRDAPENARQALGAVLFNLRLLQGRLPEMAPAMKVSAERYPGVPSYRAALARAYAGEPDRQQDAAAAFGELSQNGFGNLPSDALLPLTLSLLAEVCWSLGDAERAPEIYRRLLPRDGECILTGLANTAAGAVSRSLALLAATMGRWDDAERHFEEALRMNATLRDQPYLAQTRAQYGDMLLRRNRAGDRERAIALLTEALAFAKESGMGKVERDSERLLTGA